MILLIIKLFFSLFIPTFIGMSLVQLFFRKIHLHAVFTLALSYGLGCGLLSQWMLILGMAQIRYSMINISVPLLIVAIILYFIQFKWKKAHFLAQQMIRDNKETLVSPDKDGNGLGTKIVIFISIGFLLYNGVLALWTTFKLPIYTWDAMSFIAFRGKVFFYEEVLFKHASMPHSSYPLHVPFQLTWTALNLGQWHESLVKVIFPSIALSYMVIQYAFVRAFTTKLFALLSIVLLLSSNLFTYHISIAYRDLTMLSYNCSTIMLLLLWFKTKDDGFLLTAAFFSGFTTFVKLEGTLYLLIHTLLFFIIAKNIVGLNVQNRIAKLFKFIIPSFGICIFYHSYKLIANVTGATQKFTVDFTMDKLERVTEILFCFTENLFITGNWSMVWALFVLSLINATRIKQSFETRTIVLILSIYFTLYFGVALFTGNYVSIAGDESITVLSRILLHFFPLSVLSIILINSPKSKTGRI